MKPALAVQQRLTKSAGSAQAGAAASSPPMAASEHFSPAARLIGRPRHAQRLLRRPSKFASHLTAALHDATITAQIAHARQSLVRCCEKEEYLGLMAMVVWMRQVSAVPPAASKFFHFTSPLRGIEEERSSNFPNSMRSLFISSLSEGSLSAPSLGYLALIAGPQSPVPNARQRGVGYT
ncbi:hypothetical protein BDY21DRAFT_333127, partial [Lineolata rhizophorae]